MVINKPDVKTTLPTDYVLLSMGTLDTIAKIFPFKPETLGIKHLSK